MKAQMIAALATLVAASPASIPAEDPTPVTVISDVPLYSAPVSTQLPVQTGYLEWKRKQLVDSGELDSSELDQRDAEPSPEEVAKFNVDLKERGSGKVYGQGLGNAKLAAPGVQAWPAYRGFPTLGTGPSQQGFFEAGTYQVLLPGLVPEGVNPIGCVPKAGQLPIVLVPGTFETAYTNWAFMGKELADKGFCVYTFNHNPIKIFGMPGALQFSAFMGNIEENAIGLGSFIDDVLKLTGAKQVDLVGHSQGAGAMPYYYIKFLMGDTFKVRKNIGLAPSLGTNFYGIDALFNLFSRHIWEFNANLLIKWGFNSAALDQQLIGSDFGVHLKEGGSFTRKGVEYVNIATIHDNVLLPYSNCLPAQEEGKNITNIVLQGVCAQDASDHASLPYSKNALQIVLNHLLDLDNPIACVPEAPSVPITP